MCSFLRPVVALLVLPLLALTGCGSDTEDPVAGSTAGAEAGAFPVSIKNKFGTAEIKSAPQRVVTVGLVEQDALLALGVVPVATTEWFGEKPGALFPWAKEKLGSAAVPTVLNDKDGIQFEKLASLQPDLIIGLYSGITAEDYKKLEAIAPTVAQPAGVPDYGVAWQDVARTVGQAVGKAKQADELVKGIEQRFATVRSEHPEFQGKTALAATPWEGYFVYGTQDPRSRLLTDFGFTLPSGLDKVIGDKFGGNISAERLSVLDQQVLVWFPAKGGTAKLKADPLYMNFKVRTEGRDVFIEENYDDQVYGAIQFVSVLSLPIVLDQLVPKLSKAVDGDPATNA
ncbi:iron complex transport system substrate-binding protein [Kribbella sp. VKM Ac-2527]|uniref:Iron complex transport system substrate-binding protein n=1 Tax=Kribbella caucasensis TaxID=2512215 RepID=A0A4R6K527_9ACTN|nr:iron-siderophore ABC transporter substrate-binding protein [Kribbella sp. VKM Ac-2527]TDO43987.1 iron complex transport system substrate-binding protein [Kribbella sp. VKM Ac-2527]